MNNRLFNNIKVINLVRPCLPSPPENSPPTPLLLLVFDPHPWYFWNVKKYLDIDYKKCDPAKCDPDTLGCKAAKTCTKKLLVQEEPGNGPILFSSNACIGCGKCARECPCNAITISSG
jgi:ATP-binding cassette subfamily E protein 1